MPLSTKEVRNLRGKNRIKQEVKNVVSSISWPWKVVFSPINLMLLFYTFLFFFGELRILIQLVLRNPFFYVVLLRVAYN